MVRIKGLKRIFPSKDGEVHAIDGIDLSLPNKGLVFVIGRSGSGKSTLLNLIAGFDRPTEGEILVDGKDVTVFNEKKLAEYHYGDIGFVFQNYSLIEEITVGENVAYGSKISPRRKRNLIEEALSDVGLSGYSGRKAKTLSGGEKQRVALARALLKKPKLLLCDEPCGNLDGVSSKLVMEILKKASNDSLVVVVSHNLNDAYGYGDRVISLEQGKIVTDDVYAGQKEGDESPYLSDLNAISEKDLRSYNRKIKQGKIDGIHRRKDLFVPYEDKGETPPAIEKKEENKDKGKFIFSVLRLLNRGFGKTGAFMIMIGLILSLFSICFAIAGFSADRIYQEATSNSSQSYIPYYKGIYIEDGDSVSSRTPYLEGEEAIFKEKGYEGGMYPLLSYPVILNGSGNLHQGYSVGTSNFSSFYSRETCGIIVCDEAFLKRNLGIEEVKFLAKLDEEHPSGIYVTDYFADSASFYNPVRFPDYSSLLGWHKSSVSSYYVNGIIETGYKEKIGFLAEKREQAGDNSIFLEPDCIDAYQYMAYALNACYTYNKDFLDGITYQGMIYSTHQLLHYEGGDFHFSDSPGGVGYSDNLEEGSLMIASSKLSRFFPGMEMEQIEEEINKLCPMKFDLEVAVYSQYPDSFPKDGIEIKKIYIQELHPEYRISELSSQDSGGYWLDYEGFKDIRKLYEGPIAYCLEDTEKAFAIKDAIEESSPIYPSTPILDAASQAERAIGIFGNTFNILQYVCLALGILSVGFYAFSMVSSNRYRIGVLKSLGYGGGELTGYYAASLFGFVLAVVGVYALSYWLFLGLIGDSLLSAMATLWPSASYLQAFNLFSFDVPLFFIAAACFVGLSAIIVFVYLFVLRKISAVKVLQNKE